MSIYTCLDMISDCRGNRPAGWSYLISTYIPIIRKLLAQYYSARAADTQLIERVLKMLHAPGSSLYAAPGPTTEREWVAMLRQEVLRVVEMDRASSEPEIPLDLETLFLALEPLTATERQFVWMEAMGYSVEATAKVMNLEPSTIQKARDRAEEGLRTNMDHWKRGMIGANGLRLSLLATAARTKDCLHAKAYLDTIDGRITWGKKKEYEFHMASCWHCVDNFCRIREVDFALASAKPLTADEAKPFRRLLGLPAEEKKGLFARMFAG